MAALRLATVTLALVGGLVSQSALAQVWLLDFGASNSWRGASQVGLDANGNAWNSFPPYAYVGSLVTSGSASNAAYAPISGSPGTDSYNGPLGSAVSNPLSDAEVDAAVIDSAALGLLGGSKAGAVDYMVAQQGRFAIKWLNPNLTYDATFFGSFRYAADDTRIAAYADGTYATEVASVNLDVGRGGIYNDSRTATLGGLVPTATDGDGRQLSFEFGGLSGTTNGYLNSMSLYGYIGYLSGGTTVLSGAPAAGYVAIGTYPNGDPRSVDTMIGGGSTVTVNDANGIYWNSTLVAGTGGGTVDSGISFRPYRLGGSGTLAVTGTGLLTLSRPADFAGVLSLSGGNLALTGSGVVGTGRLALDGGTLRITDPQAIGAGGLAVASGITTLENTAGIDGLAGSVPVTLAGGGATLQCWANGKQFSLGTGTATVEGFNNLNAWAGGFILDGEIVGSGTINWWGSGSLTLSGSNGGFTGRLIAGSNDGTLNLANVDALRAAVLSAGTAHTVAFAVPGDNTYNLGGLTGAGPISLGGNSLSIATALSRTFGGDLSGSGGVTIAGGTQVFAGSNTYTGTTAVQAGTLRLASAGAAGGSRVVPLAGGVVAVEPQVLTTVGGLDPAAGGLTDVGAGLVTVAAGLTAPDMVAALLVGRGDGSWNGPAGITSSTAAADVAASVPRTVGWLDNGDGTVTFAFAAPGDTNLDWNIDVLDAANFLTGGKFNSGTPASWIDGDFGYDGVVDVLDAADFLSTGLFNAGVYNAAPGTSPSVAVVPEPSTVVGSVIGLVVAMAAAGRRRIGRRVGALLALLIVGGAAADHAAGQVWLLDFGGSNSYRGASQVGPDANGNVWNSFPPTFYVANLLTSGSATTGAAYAYGSGSATTDSYNGPLGTAVSNPLTQSEVDSAVIDSAALGLLGGSKAGAVDYQRSTQGRFAVKWLNQNLTYDATFFGSFKFAADDTRFKAFSDGTYATEVAAASLNVGRAGVYNASRTVTLAGLVPTANDALGRQLTFQYAGASGTTTGYVNSMALYGYIGYLAGGTTVLNGAPTAGYVASGTYANGDPRSVDTMIGGGSTVTVNDANGIYWNSTLVAGTGGGTVNAGISFGPYCLSGSGNLAVTGTGVFTLSRPGSFTGTLSVAGGGTTLIGSGGSLNAASGITINGGRLRYDAATPLTAPVTFTAGTLSGTGAIGTAVVAGSGNTLSPGNSPGSQAFSVGLGWASGGTYVWELNSLSGTAGTNFDELAVSGGSLDLSTLGTGTAQRFTIDLTTLTGSNTLGPLDSGYSPGTPYEFSIATYGGAGLLVPSGFSTAAGSDLTTLFNFSLANWQGTAPAVSDLQVRVDGAGTGLSLMIVPEPTTAVGWICSALLAVSTGLLRRRGKG